MSKIVLHYTAKHSPIQVGNYKTASCLPFELCLAFFYCITITNIYHTHTIHAKMAILRQVAYIASLVPLVVADIGTGGYLVVGNDAPWGLPDSSFRPPSQANATGSFTIPAFNLSSSNASLQGDGHNWNIEISVQANIPLNGSTDKSLSAAQKNEFTQFVSMSLNNVENTEVSKIAKENKMCGYIMLGLNSNATTDNQDDATKGGNCDFFSQQCQDDLQAAAQRQSSDCGSVTIPDSCHDWLGPSGDQIFQMTSFGKLKTLVYIYYIYPKKRSVRGKQS